MGGFYMKMSNIKTSTVSKSAYNSRTKEYDETQGRTFNYSSKEDHVYHNVKLPEGCPEEWNNAERLWNENEKFEKTQNTERHGKQFIIAIPQELTQEQTEKAINEFQDYFAKMGYASQADQHEPESRRSADEVEKNRHVHILTTARKITNGEFERVKEKKAFANDRDANGKPIYNPDKPDAKNHKEYRVPVLNENGEQKYRERPGKGKEMLWERVRVQDNPLDRRETVEAARAEWARICNQYLSEGQQIDHRSYERQGSDKVAQVHEGVGSHQEQDDRKAYNEQVKQLNRETEEAKKAAETRIKEKGEQSHDNRESETINGDHQGSDGVGRRVTSGDRPQGQGEQQTERKAESGNSELQGDSASARDRVERLGDELQQVGERIETTGRRTEEQDIAGERRTERETTQERARTEATGSGIREASQGEREPAEVYRQRFSEIRTEAEREQAQEDAERSRIDEVAGGQQKDIDGIRENSKEQRILKAGADENTTEASRVGREQQGIKAKQQSINRESNANIRGQRSFTQSFNEHLERVRGGFTAVRDKLKGTFENVLKANLQRAVERLRHLKSQAPEQEKPKQTTQEQPKQTQTAQSPLERMQQAQRMNAAEPTERSENNMSRGTNSLLQQAKASNEANKEADTVKNKETPKNEAMDKFKELKAKTEANREEELEEAKHIHRGRHR